MHKTFFKKKKRKEKQTKKDFPAGCGGGASLQSQHLGGDRRVKFKVSLGNRENSPVNK